MSLLLPTAVADSWPEDDAFEDQDDFELGPEFGWDTLYATGNIPGAPTPIPGLPGRPPHDGSTFGGLRPDIGQGAAMTRKLGLVTRTDLVISLEAWTVDTSNNCLHPAPGVAAQCNGGEINVIFYGDSTPVMIGNPPMATIPGGYAFSLNTGSTGAPGTAVFRVWDANVIAHVQAPMATNNPQVPLLPNTKYNVKIVVAGNNFYGYIDDVLTATWFSRAYVAHWNSFSPQTSYSASPFDLKGGPNNYIGVYSHSLAVGVGLDKFRVNRNTVYIQDSNDKARRFQDQNGNDGQGNACTGGIPTWANNEIEFTDCQQAVRLWTADRPFANFVLEFDYRYSTTDNYPMPFLVIQWGDIVSAAQTGNLGNSNGFIQARIALDPGGGNGQSGFYCGFYPTCGVGGTRTSLGENPPASPAKNHVRLVDSATETFVYINGYLKLLLGHPDLVIGNHLTIWMKDLHRKNDQGAMINDKVWIDNLRFSIKGLGDNFFDDLQTGWTVEQGTGTQSSWGGEDVFELSYPAPNQAGYSRLSIVPPQQAFFGFSGYKVSADIRMIETRAGSGATTPQGAIIVARHHDPAQTPTEQWIQFDFGGAAPGFANYIPADICGAGCKPILSRDEYDGDFSWPLQGLRHVEVMVQADPFWSPGASNCCWFTTQHGVPLRLTGWIDGALVATYTVFYNAEPFGQWANQVQPLYGSFGAAAEANSRVQFDNFDILMDTDVDGVSDIEEINGYEQLQGVGIFDSGDVGQYSFATPPEQNCQNDCRLALSAKYPRGEQFQLKVRYQNAGPNPNQIKTFVGSGTYSVYKFDPQFLISNIWPSFEMQFIPIITENLKLKVAWFGYLSETGTPDFKSDRQASTVAGDQEGGDPFVAPNYGLNLPASASGIQWSREFIQMSSEWEFSDFDRDRMSDWRENRVLLRTNIDYGFLSSGDWGVSTSDWLWWDGLKYVCKSTGTPAACENRASGFDPQTLPLIGYLADGSALHGIRTSTQDVLGFEDAQEIQERQVVPRVGYTGHSYKFTRLAAGQQFTTFDDRPIEGYADYRQVIGRTNPQVSNVRWAFLFAGNNWENPGAWESIEQVRTTLTDQYGYADTNDATCERWDPEDDKVVVFFGDGNSQPPANVDICSEYLPSQGDLSDAFDTLTTYLSRDDLLYVISFSGGGTDATGAYIDSYSSSLQPNAVSDTYRIHATEWDAYFDTASRAAQIVFITASGKGAGLAPVVTADGGRVFLPFSSSSQSTAWTDNKNAAGTKFCEDEICDDDSEIEVEAWTESMYYSDAVLRGSRYYIGAAGDTRNVWGDANHDGLISLAEVKDFVSAKQSYTATVWPNDAWRRMTPFLEDSPYDASGETNAVDGLPSAIVYF